jgi:AcrR family transcriptional regulator
MSRQKNREEKRAVIVAAAVESFKNRRFDEVTLDEVAKRAGVGKGTLYLYFKNKEELFAELAGEGTAEMAARIREIAELDRSYKERLFLFGNEFAAFARKQHGWMRMVMQASSESLASHVHPKHAQVKAAVLDLLQRGSDEGVLRDDVPPEVLECLLVGSVFFRQRQGERMDREIDLEQLLHCFWDAAQRR